MSAYIRLAFILCATFCTACADLYDIFKPCCHEGAQYSGLSGRCDNYPAPVANVSDNDQAACLAIIEVCCMKQTHYQTCEDGKQTALDKQVCAIRDTDPGAEQFRECCNCCQLGLVARTATPACQSPGLGEPCDSKYRECCRGEASGNLSFSDVTSCDLNNPCEQRCLTNDDGNVECRCYDGYILADDTISCEDIDECADGSQRCPQSQVCVNTRGSFTCFSRCPPHLTQNPLTGLCEDGTHACEPGYRPVGGGCEDINECAIGIDSCAAGERCENTVGSFVCRRERNCGTGYTLDDTTQRCLDIDECALGTHNCDEGFTCLNIQGSFRCVPRTCPEGNRFDAATGDCIPVQCPTGLKPNVALNCVDIDECAELGNSACKRHQRCINTRGSYYCRNYVNCPPGYEPTLSTGCQDVDECQTEGICQQSCINVLGSYFCSCSRGYQLRDDKRSCQDIDECTQFGGRGGRTGVCGGQCVNLPGSFKCECSNGWRLKSDARTCEDINECVDRTAYCPHADSICFNTRGGYKCPIVKCPDGFIKTNSTGQQNSIRCKRVSMDCPECRKGLISRTYNFLSFSSNVLVPAPLFSMTGSRLVDKYYEWGFELVSARPLKGGLLPAEVGDFTLESSRYNSRVTLIKRIVGPQDVVLKLAMNVTSFSKGYEGTAESRIYLYITEDDASN